MYYLVFQRELCKIIKCNAIEIMIQDQSYIRDNKKMMNKMYLLTSHCLVLILFLKIYLLKYIQVIICDNTYSHRLRESSFQSLNVP